MYWSHQPTYGMAPWPPELANSLSLIKEAVQGERSDELFYDQLIQLAPNKDEAAIIAGIRDDERRHNQLFRYIYKAYTGCEIESVGNGEPEKVTSYTAGIQKALFGELAAVEKYYAIWHGLPPGPYRDIVFGIILDELRHASKYNYLFAKNLNRY